MIGNNIKQFQDHSLTTNASSQSKRGKRLLSAMSLHVEHLPLGPPLWAHIAQNLHVTTKDSTRPPMLVEATKFRPLDPHDSNDGLPSPNCSGREAQQEIASSAGYESTFFYESLFGGECHVQPPRAKRFKLPSSSALSLKMRPSFPLHKTLSGADADESLNRDERRDRSPTEKSHHDVIEAITATETAANGAVEETTPREPHQHCIQDSPPFVKPSSSSYTFEEAGPYPSKVYLPLF
jgi:hypothetical protein